MSKEIWRDIEGCDGIYQVSDMGRVKSLDREIHIHGGSYTRKGVILKPITHKKGYTYADLHVKGKTKRRSRHKLVLDAFYGCRQEGMVVNHINGVRSDNRISNLEYVTHRENLTTCFRSDRDKMTSRYVGVSFDKTSRLWRAEIGHKSKQYDWGFFSNEISASEAYQKALREINKGTFNYDECENFRLSVRKSRQSSKYKGVSLHKGSNKWKAYITENGKQRSLGYYEEEIDAHKAYQKEAEKIK